MWCEVNLVYITIFLEILYFMFLFPESFSSHSNFDGTNASASLCIPQGCNGLVLTFWFSGSYMLFNIFFSNFQIENVDGKTIYSGIIQVVKFIHKRICLQNGSWVRCFGRLTWPRISELIISNFLSKVCLSNLLMYVFNLLHFLSQYPKFITQVLVIFWFRLSLKMHQNLLTFKRLSTILQNLRLL